MNFFQVFPSTALVTDLLSDSVNPIFAMTGLEDRFEIDWLNTLVCRRFSFSLVFMMGNWG